MITPARWGRTAVAFGLTVVAMYLTVALRLLPAPLLRMLFIAMGPLLAVAAFALGQWLAAERDSIALRIAILLHIVAAAFLSAMAIVQNVNYAFTRNGLARATDRAQRELLEAVFHGVDGVQLGLDLAWDLWLTFGAIFLALALLRHPRFGPLVAWPGVAAGTLVLLLNLWTFPVPPAQAGLFDAGPLLAVWYLAVVITARFHRTRSEQPAA